MIHLIYPVALYRKKFSNFVNMKESTMQDACNILVDVLVVKGVKNVVLSPGSRNAPLIVAISRCEMLQKYVVVDERSAAFMALGMARESKSPVAIVCTSGSAMLNYAPALAEAYYSEIPLIAISADRSEEWIDQDDGQAIHQYKMLANIVKDSFDIPARYDDKDSLWYVNRMINEACLLAGKAPVGPVHINFHFADNLYGVKSVGENCSRQIDWIGERTISDETLQKLSRIYNESAKVMIVGGFVQSNALLQRCLSELSKDSRTVVFVETITNVFGEKVIRTIDRTISAVNEDDLENFAPDLLISFGGATVTRMLKQMIRRFGPKHHWHIGVKHNIIDVSKKLTVAIDMHPEDFFEKLLKYIQPANEMYAERWSEINSKAQINHKNYINDIPWCDLKAFDVLSKLLPSNIDLHFSNGTPVRYAQLYGDVFLQKSSCNRGVSGIDGCSSTALGAALLSEKETLLITGDMSFSYDTGGLFSQYKPNNFKVIVIHNGGGGIFRFIKGPDTLNELESYFEVRRDLDIAKYAEAMGYNYFTALDQESLEAVLPDFLNDKSPAVLSIITDGELNAKILRDYFRNLKN